MVCFVSVVTAAVLMGASDVRSDELVVFYPGYAYLDEGGQTWTIPIHGVIFEPEPYSIVRSQAVAAIRRQLDVVGGTREAEILDRRMGLFLVDHERGKEVSIRIGSRAEKLAPSAANGHFRSTVQLPVAEARRLVRSRQSSQGWITFRAVTRRGDRRLFAGRAQLIGPSGLSLISDIDDTIKETHVRDRKEMLANTFRRDFKPVAGMPELYRRATQRGVVFHYVSGSPWQLYRPLSEFRQARGFPPGSFHLKHFRLTDSTVLDLLGSQEKTKLQAIEPILAAYPGRRFILVGDSGEQDPEIYGKIARRHPGQIVAIFIRNVTDEAAEGRRLRAAFQAVETKCVKLFRRPEELKPPVDELIRVHAGP